MRAFDRDLIRGGHYGQRSCEPHKQAEHMAAPTKPAGVKKVLANSEPSTHGLQRRRHCRSKPRPPPEPKAPNATTPLSGRSVGDFPKDRRCCVKSPWT